MRFQTSLVSKSFATWITFEYCNTFMNLQNLQKLDHNDFSAVFLPEQFLCVSLNWFFVQFHDHKGCIWTVWFLHEQMLFRADLTRVPFNIFITFSPSWPVWIMFPCKTMTANRACKRFLYQMKIVPRTKAWIKMAFFL